MTDMRLIDANAIPMHKVKIVHAFGIVEGCVVFPNSIANATTIDAVPVVHGQWKYTPPRVMEYQDKHVLIYGSDNIVCTACEGKAISADWLKFSYCPRCGAKMDGGAEQ